MKASQQYKWFRRIAIAEGISFLVLLAIAMPLKYVAGLPMAVKIVGYLHGFLFVAFVILAMEVRSVATKSYSWLLVALFASLLPFGTLIMDKRWKKEEQLFLKNAGA